MENVATIGEPPWTRNDLLRDLETFTELYARRPIQDNQGGMHAPHMFYTWFALKTLQPSVVIESGVFQGQSTWLIEQACPDAAIHCIDLTLEHIMYRSERAVYHTQDFATLDWRDVPKDDTVVFFDDHQNAYERVKAACWFGFKHLLFDDNYPISQGNCYSLKQALAHAGFTHVPESQPTTWNQLKTACKRALNSPVPNYPDILPNTVDAAYLQERLAVYYEFPPVIKDTHTLWNDSWSDEHYPTSPPLLRECNEPYQQVFADEAKTYVWFCYARIQ